MVCFRASKNTKCSNSIGGAFDDEAPLDEILDRKGVAVCYHLISSAVPTTSNDEPIADLEANLRGTLTLLDEAVSAKPQRMIFLSSGGTDKRGQTGEQVTWSASPS